MAQANSTPKVYAVVADFETPADILRAAEEVRKSGYTKLDALTPFPVHGLDEALGMSRSKLGYVVAAAGAVGVGAALLLQWFTNVIDYPLLVGGKPLFAMEYSIPVTFELMVLFASFAAVIGLFVFSNLPQMYHPLFNYSKIAGASDDRFLLVIEAADPMFSAPEAVEALRRAGGQHVEVVTE